jgi:hypothetical protein
MSSKRFLIAAFALVLAACGGGGGGGSGTPPPANRAPVAAADTARIRPGTSADIDLLANDRDDDGDALSIEPPGAHASATFAVSGNRLRVTPAAGFGGTLTFAYRARDVRGAFSASTTVTVEVGAIARAMLVLSPDIGAGPPRAIVAGAPPDERTDLVTLGACNQTSWAMIAADGRRILSRRCVSSTRSDVVLSQPRAATLVPPTVVYGNAPLAPGQFISGNFSEVIVAERVSNPDDLTLESTYDLVRVDIAQRAAVQRMPLTGLDQVALVRYGGGLRRALIIGRETNGNTGHFIADLDAGTVRRVTTPGDIDIENSTISPDGRYLVSNWAIPDSVRGYDTQGPVQSQVFWTVPGTSVSSYVTSTQFLPLPEATLLVESTDLFSRDVVAWVVPLATPANARELVRFTASTEHQRMQVRNGIATYASDAGGGRSHLNLVRVSTGEVLGPLTPAGGVHLESVDFFTGTSLLFIVAEESAGAGSPRFRRAARIRVDAPGVVQMIAPSLAPELYSLTIDQDETTVGLRAANAAGSAAAWLVDVNLPATPMPLAGALQPAEQAAFLLMLGAPDP